jgi:hypothetical protein
MPATVDDLRVSRIASLTLINAMIFQEILASNNPRVKPLARTISGKNLATNFAGVWEDITTNIDYIPIFNVAREIAIDLQGIPDIDNVLRVLAETAQGITSRRAALRHDLMGRIYHRLLADAKYFGAYYTTVPAAALLLKLTLDPNNTDIDWSDLNTIKKLRASDLSCGTGTLLKATLQTIVDNHVRACAAKGEKPDLQLLHQILVENVLFGFDVIPFAIHLAASALAIHEPEVQFGEMHLYTLPLGGSPKLHLGSLEFLANKETVIQADLFGGASGSERVTGAGDVREKAAVPYLDLCVMNPPFTRSVGGNLLFGNLPAKQRATMQTALKKLVQTTKVKANITSGLGSVFVAIGHKYVKPSGHLSLVLPRALLSGVAWKDTRELIGAQYHLNYIVTSHQPNAWNFSENTELSECMTVARRRSYGESSVPTKVVNLWRKPTSSIEALAFARTIMNASGVMLEGHTGTDSLEIGGQKIGEVILCPPKRASAGVWRYEAAYAQTDLCRTALYLSQGQLYVPGRGVVGGFPITTLRELGTLGPDRRDIHDGFTVSDTFTPYSALWGHDTESVQSMSLAPNKYLTARAKAAKGRNLRDATVLWSRAGRLLIAERLWLDTTRLISIRLTATSLSNTWWTFAPFDDLTVPVDDIERILALWINSTLGILSFVAARVDTRGPWIAFKKPMLEDIEVINPVALTKKQRQALIKAYEKLSGETLQQIPDINADGVRARIDDAIMKALGLNDNLASLRQMTAQELLVRGAR